MADVIKSWNLTGPEEEEWQDARNTWRLPYWDWARKQKYENDDGTSYNEGFALPYVFTLPKVAIYPPSGTKLDQDNPLWGFVNPEKDANGDPLPMGSMPGDKKKWNINDDAKLPVSISLILDVTILTALVERMQGRQPLWHQSRRSKGVHGS